MHHKLTPEQYFQLCFKKLPEINHSNILKVIEKYNFDKNNLERLLIKTDLENFTDLLWQFGIGRVHLALPSFDEVVGNDCFTIRKTVPVKVFV